MRHPAVRLPATFTCAATTSGPQAVFSVVPSGHLDAGFTFAPSSAHVAATPSWTALTCARLTYAAHAHRGRARRARRGPLPAHWSADRLLVATRSRLRRAGAGNHTVR